MRSVLAVLLCTTLFLSTLYAQVGTPQQSKPKVGSPLGVPVRDQVVSNGAAEPQIPPFMYECDGDQCEKGGGGAIWLFEGNRGVAMWRYKAIANLTVTKFDGRIIMLRRDDPVGSYSSKYAKDGHWVEDYTGRIHGGDYVEGLPGWHASIPDALCAPFSECPLSVEQVLELGQNAFQARLYASALKCFHIAAGQGNADGEGLEAIMLMDGWGGYRTGPEIMRFLEDSANRGSYPGANGLARAYAEGKLVASNPQLAAYWNGQAGVRQAELQREASEQQERERQQARGASVGEISVAVLVAVALAGAVAAASHGSAGGMDAEQEELSQEYRKNTQRLIQEQRIQQRESQ
jgi:hypothetical protein